MTQPLFSPVFGRTSPLEQCVTGMISSPRQHASCSPKVVSASAAITKLLHRARMLCILEHPCDSRFWDVAKIEAHAAQLRTASALADYCILVQHAEKCIWLQRFATYCSQVCNASKDFAVGVAGLAPIVNQIQ